MTVPNGNGATGATWQTGLVYFIKAFVGPGCLSLPLAFQNSGLGLGLGLLLALGVIVTFNLRTMTLCKQHLAFKGVKTYADLTQEALGTTARRCVEVMINGVQLGICAVYFDFFAENSRAFLPEDALKEQTMIRILIAAIFPVYAALALLKSIETIAPYAALANALVYGSIAVAIFFASNQIHLVYGTHRRGDEEAKGELKWWTLPRVPTFYSTVVYSFEGVCSLLPVENALARPERDMALVTYVGMTVVTLTYASVGAIAYAAWPNLESASITYEITKKATGPIWKTLSASTNVATIIAVILTFPVQLFPSIELLEKTFGFDDPRTESSRRRRSMPASMRRRTSTTTKDGRPMSPSYHPCVDDQLNIEMADLERPPGPVFVVTDDDDFDDDDRHHHHHLGDRLGESGFDDEVKSIQQPSSSLDKINGAAENTNTSPVAFASGSKKHALSQTPPRRRASPVSPGRDDSTRKFLADHDDDLERDNDDDDDDDAGGPRAARRHVVVAKNPLHAADFAAFDDDDDEDELDYAPPPQRELRPWRRMGFRIVVVFFVGLLAAVVPQLDKLIALIGALTGSALSMVIPSLIDIYCPRPNRRKWELPADLAILTFGLIGGIAGTYQALTS